MREVALQDSILPVTGFIDSATNRPPELSSKRPHISLTNQTFQQKNKKCFSTARMAAVLGDARTQPGPQHFTGFRDRPKTLFDFGSGIVRLAGISAVYPKVAGIYSFRPDHHAGAVQRLAIAPRHPLSRTGRELSRMSLQFRQILERIGAAQLAGLYQTHEQIAHLRPMQCAIEQSVLSVQNGPF